MKCSVMKNNANCKLAKVILLRMLLEFCDIKLINENLESVNNDFFHHMSAQLYISTLQGGRGYLNDEQITMVKKFVDGNWDGSLGHFDELFDSQLIQKD